MKPVLIKKPREGIVEWLPKKENEGAEITYFLENQ